MYAKSPIIVRGGVLMDFIIECKITPGMELFEQPMFTTDLVNLYNRNIFKTSLYIYIFQEEKCRIIAIYLYLWLALIHSYDQKSSF